MGVPTANVSRRYAADIRQLQERVLRLTVELHAARKVIQGNDPAASDEDGPSQPRNPWAATGE